MKPTKTYKNKTLEEAKKIAEKDGFKLRVIQEDGLNFAHTMDLRSDRINLKIKNGIVIHAKIG